MLLLDSNPLRVVSNGSKILNWKQITTYRWYLPFDRGCVQWFKDTKLKANHNERQRKKQQEEVVSNGSKILNWKQITTVFKQFSLFSGCVQWFKDTKLKANHNMSLIFIPIPVVVSNGSKILNWKQITTEKDFQEDGDRCVQWFKDTKLKANHNLSMVTFSFPSVVSNGSKILNWKQITTSPSSAKIQSRCVQWFKDTKLKANHN